MLINNFNSSFSIDADVWKYAIDIPIKKTPNKLTARLPKGSPGYKIYKKYPITHLNQAPIAAAKPIIRKFVRLKIAL